MSTEHSLSLSAIAYGKIVVSQMNIDSNSEDENFSKEPLNIRLMSYFNQSIDGTIQSDDYENSEEAIKLKIRRVTKRRENEEYASISDD